MRYSWDECKLYVIDRLSWKIQGQVKDGVLESRDYFVEQASCLAHSYFRYKRCREVPQIQGSEEWEQMWPDIDRIMDELLENGRRKCNKPEDAVYILLQTNKNITRYEQKRF